MVVADLNYLETIEATSVKGGILNFASFQGNFSSINQGALAAAGNGGLINVGNTAAAVNVASPLQANL